jgi:hypothetical protein
VNTPETLWGRSIDFWTAVGTLAAVGVALGLPAIAACRRLIDKPLLTLTFANQSRCRRLTQIDSPLVDAGVKAFLDQGFEIVGVFFRLQVTNTGRSPAHSVHGRFVGLLTRSGEPHQMSTPSRCIGRAHPTTLHQA